MDDRLSAGSGAQADTTPPPTWYDINWDSTKAAAHSATLDVPNTAFNRRRAKLISASAELARAMGKSAADYLIDIPDAPIGLAGPIDEAGFWRDLKAYRARAPGFLKDIGNDPGDFETRIKTEFAAERSGLQERMARQGVVGNLIGGAVGSQVDPINFASNFIGGPAAKGVFGTAKAIVFNGVVNAGVEYAETPLIRAEREAQGGELTDQEASANLKYAFLGGAGMTAGMKGLHMAGQPVAAQISKALSLDDRALASALRSSVRGDWELTPDQAAALYVVERRSEVQSSNPFQQTYAGIDAHEKLIAQTLRRLAAAPEPPVTATRAPAAPVARPVAGGAGAGGGGNLHAGIVTFFRGKGYSEMQARGIAAGIHAESGSNPNIRNETNGALGLGQWLGPRRAAIIRRYGPNPSIEQQLEFLHHELQGGDAGGKAVLAGKTEAEVLSAYIGETRADGTGWGFMRPLHGSQREGDISRGMAALGRAGEIPDTPLGGDLAEASPLPPDPALTAERVLAGVEPLAIRPDAGSGLQPILMPDGRAMGLQSFRPDEIGVNAELMQFKSGGDQLGVTERLRGVTRWDPFAAGTLTVWQSKSGETLIADGHQRLGLAKRIHAADPAQNIGLNAYVMREADGFTAEDARILTALKNIGEGSGTGLDAAKVFRALGRDGDTLLASLPPKSALVRDGKALSRLSDDALGSAINEVIPESYAAAIGHLVPDPAQHQAMVELLAKLEPPNRRQAEAIIRQALDAGFHGETQVELFGVREITSSLFAFKARALDKTLSELRKLKGAFSVAARNAEALDAAGNRIDVAASEAAARGNAQALGLVEALALRKGNGVSEIFQRAAERLAAGEPIGRVVKDTVAGVRELDLERALADAGDAGDAALGSGRDGFAAGEDGGLPLDPAELTPATRDALEASGQGGLFFADPDTAARFDDPAGDGVQAAAQSVWHDIKAEAEQPRFKVDIGNLLKQSIDEDFPAARAAYEAIDDPQTRLTSEGGRVLNVDVARELSPGYRADRSRSADVHDPASKFVKRLYAEKLQEPPPEGFDKLVLLTGGGTGAGKSSGLEQVPEAVTAGIIYDTNMNGLESARKKIDQALAADWGVSIVYTYRDPIEALVQGAFPRAERMGRTVPLDKHIETHLGARDTIDALQQHYRNDPRVTIKVIDNSRGRNNATLTSLEDLPKIDHIGLHERATAETHAAFQRGDIGRATFRGTLGERADAVRGGAPARGRDLGAGDRGQPQPQDGAAASSLIDLGDGRGPRSISDIDAELTAFEQGIDAIRSCL